MTDAIALAAPAEPNFRERFAAFTAEAGEILAVGLAEACMHLDAADAVVRRLEAQGFSIRTEMPIGRAGRINEMRFLVEFYARLTR